MSEGIGLDALLTDALKGPHRLSVDQLARMLAESSMTFEAELFAAARELKSRLGKTEVLPRGLIETGNICAKNCSYCGIRRGNLELERYRMTDDEVNAIIDESKHRGYPAVAFQSGEIESEANTAFFERAIRYADPLEVTLSLGEQQESVYQRWKVASGDRILRYLIRIETSNRALYSAIHPQSCSFDRRVNCIRTLKRLGYVTGSGVMIGIPGQTIEDLARDIVFFGDERLDMVGMGPYLPGGSLKLTLRMIALVRLYLHDVNIVAASALEVVDRAQGRNLGIAAGANVIMPCLTPPKYRALYAIYPGKEGVSTVNSPHGGEV